MRVFYFEENDLQCLPQFWRRCPARLAVRSERHWIRDTNHTAADQPFAASKQDNHDAEAKASNSPLKHDHQKRGDDESTFEHVHVPLVKYPSRFLEQMKQQKLREMRINTITFRQKHVELRRTEIMNKTVHQPSSHCRWIFSLSF